MVLVVIIFLLPYYNSIIVINWWYLAFYQLFHSFIARQHCTNFSFWIKLDIILSLEYIEYFMIIWFIILRLMNQVYSSQQTEMLINLYWSLFHFYLYILSFWIFVIQLVYSGILSIFGPFAILEVDSLSELKYILTLWATVLFLLCFVAYIWYIVEFLFYC